MTEVQTSTAQEEKQLATFYQMAVSLARRLNISISDAVYLLHRIVEYALEMGY
jgi:hypothetical protein